MRNLIGLTIINSNSLFGSENNSGGRAGSGIMHILTMTRFEGSVRGKKKELRA